MSLSLCLPDLDRHAAAARALLSSLESSDPASWRRSVAGALRSLFRARAAMVITLEGETVSCQCDVDPAVVQAFHDLPTEIEAGAIHLKDGPMKALFERFRRDSTETWSMERMDIAARRLLARSAFFNEVLVPNRLRDVVGMRAALPRGEAVAWVAYASPEENPFGSDAECLLRTLLPAFKAGLALLATAEYARGVLIATIDVLPDALFLTDGRGRVVHRSRALEELLAADPEGARLLEEVGASALRLALARKSLHGVGLLCPTNQVATASARYRLHSGHVSDDLGGAQIVVRLERLTPVLPTLRALRERWGLTPREAQVTLCLAAGRSNKQIASELEMSRHTVRHHAEHIFAKLGLHSRKAMVLSLLQVDGDGSADGVAAEAPAPLH